VRSFVTYTPDQIKNRLLWEVARTVKRRGAYRVLVGKLEGKSCWENLVVDGSIILKRILKKYDGVDWITVAQDKEKWRVFANTVMNLGFHKMRGIC
jgi:hypothetical protein